MVLAHELNDFTMQEAMKVYPSLKAAFKVGLYLLCASWIKLKIFLGIQNIVPVGVALNITNPYPEANYTLPTFSQCPL